MTHIYSWSEAPEKLKSFSKYAGNEEYCIIGENHLQVKTLAERVAKTHFRLFVLPSGEHLAITIAYSL